MKTTLTIRVPGRDLAFVHELPGLAPVGSQLAEGMLLATAMSDLQSLRLDASERVGLEYEYTEEGATPLQAALCMEWGDVRWRHHGGPITPLPSLRDLPVIDGPYRGWLCAGGGWLVHPVHTGE